MLNFITRIFTYAILSAALLIVAGCGATSSSDDPELNEFEIIDTSGSNSATDPQSEILVDADEDTMGTREDGEFTLYWDVDTNDDYLIDIYINDDDRISGGRKIFSDFCDPDDDCHEDRTLECDFQNDLDLVCEDFDDNETEINITSLSEIDDEDDLPEDLYFILEVCDPFGFDCEDQTLEVRFDD